MFSSETHMVGKQSYRTVHVPKQNTVSALTVHRVFPSGQTWGFLFFSSNCCMTNWKRHSNYDFQSQQKNTHGALLQFSWFYPSLHQLGTEMKQK